MQTLTNIGDNLVKGISARYGLSYEAVVHMLVAVNNGGGSMAQFNCPELGGSGQWMRGGMTMVGDMFNNGLKNTVDNLCNELATILANNHVFPVIPAGTLGSNQWWPINLGNPSSTGSQNNTRYAVFPNRLAVEKNGQITVYDTLDHQISGVSQQQGNNESLTFNSQWGNISVNSLPIVTENNYSHTESNQTTNFAQSDDLAKQPTTEVIAPDIMTNNTSTAINASQYSVNETLDIIEKLAQLRDLGALTDAEFNEKKSALLQRI
ncbi:SHOCT domain-containing protein [Pseudoalteromonas ostreae]|uniref:SHOCT domain-containing protein n=1 Tax=Pseudoalteromonas ostreae TaxID=2774154 RepID=UPI001B3790FD|nr:SHOCT domain-containing protein [Pseudoalteromonas ostreae]